MAKKKRVYDPVVKRKYYEDNKERLLAAGRQHYANNREEMKARQYKKYREELPTYLFYAAKARSKQFGIPFSIEKTDIVIPDVCPVFGTPFEVGDRNTAPSVDKIDPTKGYVPGNIAVISMRANRLKNNATLGDLEKLIAYLRAVS
jgi:hypothetical protein